MGPCDEHRLGITALPALLGASRAAGEVTPDAAADAEKCEGGSVVHYLREECMPGPYHTQLTEYAAQRHRRRSCSALPWFAPCLRLCRTLVTMPQQVPLTRVCSPDCTCYWGAGLAARPYHKVIVPQSPLPKIRLLLVSLSCKHRLYQHNLRNGCNLMIGICQGRATLTNLHRRLLLSTATYTCQSKEF